MIFDFCRFLIAFAAYYKSPFPEISFISRLVIIIERFYERHRARLYVGFVKLPPLGFYFVLKPILVDKQNKPGISRISRKETRTACATVFKPERGIEVPGSLEPPLRSSSMSSKHGMG